MRREQQAEDISKKLAAEIEQLNRLVRPFMESIVSSICIFPPVKVCSGRARYVSDIFTIISFRVDH